MNYVLGGGGFIGSHIAKTFSAAVLDLDLRDDPGSKLDMIESGDWVFQAAHVGSIDECAKDPAATREVNVRGTMRFFEELKKRSAIPVYFSSNMVFDGSKPFYSESEIPHPTTEYGRQKRAIEKYLAATFPRYLIIRMTKVYGPKSRSFIDSWLGALKNNQEIRAADDMWSAPLYIADAMLALQHLLADTRSGICHLSGPRERTMPEIAQLVAWHVHADQSLIIPISISDLSLIEKRPIHNSLSCDTLQTQGYAAPRDIPEILHTFYT